MLNTERRDQFVQLLRDRRWDRLLLYGHAWRKDHFRSLINFSFFGTHAAAIISPRGDIEVLLSHPWDRDNIAPAIDAPVSWAADFAAALSSFAAGKVGIAGFELMETRFANQFRDAVSASSAVETVRRKKRADEIAKIERAAQLADAGYQHFVDTIRIGMAEYELVAEVESFLKSHGAEDNFMLIASGGTEVFGMKPPTDRQFQLGDSVTTELSPQVDGYFAQICRTLVLGSPSEKQRQSFEIFRQAQEAAEAFLKPGVNISDVARVQNDVFRREGFGEYTEAKYTRVRGHNLGLHPDEHPYVLEDVDCIVNEGMVLIAHPNTYLPLSGYMVFGDTLVVTRDGCARLNRTDKQLFSKDME